MMSIIKKIEKLRAESQKYTFKVTPDELASRGTRLQQFLKRVDKLIERGDITGAKDIVNKNDDFHRKELVYLLLNTGRYEKAKLFLPKKTDYPPLIHLRMHISYRLGADFGKLIEMIKGNIKEYREMLKLHTNEEQKVKEIKKAWATDLMFWGMFLAIMGDDYKAAITKYDKSYEIHPFPETLFNKFCCYNRSSDEVNAYKTLKELQSNHKDLSDHKTLIEKIRYDVACDRFRNKLWFERFLRNNSRTNDNTQNNSKLGKKIRGAECGKK